MPSRQDAIAAQIHHAQNLIRGGLETGNGAPIEEAIKELDLALSLLRTGSSLPLLVDEEAVLPPNMTAEQKRRLRAFFDEVIR